MSPVIVLGCVLCGNSILGQAPDATKKPAEPDAKSEVKKEPEPYVFMRDKDSVPSYEDASIDKMKQTPVKQVSPGVYQIGTVRLDQKTKSISFPASVNQKQGPAEYLLVTSWGATHESVFQTRTRPFHIQVAMLLLGVKQEPRAPKDGESGQAQSIEQGPITEPSSDILTGAAIEVDVHWTVEGEQKGGSIDSFIIDTNNENAKPDVRLIYNGSRVVNNMFAGEIEGSVISLITNPLALMNNVSAGRLTDDIWQVNGKALPARDHPVNVVIKLVAQKK